MKKIVGLLVALALSLALPAPVGAQAESSTITLQSAIATGKVDADFRGTGASSGDSVKVKVKKRAAGPLVLSVPPGSVLRSSNGGEQDMVISRITGIDLGGGLIRPTSRIVLNSATPVTLFLSAFCAEFEKDNPSSLTSFSLDRPDPVLACISRQGSNLSTAAMQAAVWVYTDRITYRKMSAKFDVGPDEFSAGQAIANRCAASQH